MSFNTTQNNNNENIPLTKIAVEKEWKDEISPELNVYLGTPPTYGLTDTQVSERLAKFGRNELQEKKKSKLKHFLSFCKVVNTIITLKQKLIFIIIT